MPVVHAEDIAVCCVSLSVSAGDAARLRYFPWLIVPPYSRRWDALPDSWLRFQATADALGEEFERFAFLREAYVRGNDREGDLWEAARGQSG